MSRRLLCFNEFRGDGLMRRRGRDYSPLSPEEHGVREDGLALKRLSTQKATIPLGNVTALQSGGSSIETVLDDLVVAANERY